MDCRIPCIYGRWLVLSREWFFLVIVIIFVISAVYENGRGMRTPKCLHFAAVFCYSEDVVVRGDEPGVFLDIFGRYIMNKGNGKGKDSDWSNSSLDHKRLKHFQAEVFGVGEVEEDDFAEIISKRNSVAARFASCFLLLIFGVMLVLDVSGGHFDHIEVYVCRGVVMVMSLHMIFAPPHINRYSGLRMRYSFLVFYLTLILSSTVLVIYRDVLLEAEGLSVARYGVPAAIFLVLIPVLAPLPFRSDNYILLAVLVATTFLPLIPAWGGAYYNLLDSCIIRCGGVIGYLYLSRTNHKYAEASNAMRDLSRELMRINYMDTTTGLLNKKAMQAYWNYLCQTEPASVGVLHGDLDGFAAYNEHFGHAKGDKALRELAANMYRYFKEKELYLFRCNGDEFAALIPNASVEDIREMGELMRRATFETALMIPGGEPEQITITVGCASEPMRDGHNPDFFTRADRELFEGKKQKNIVLFRSGY